MRGGIAWRQLPAEFPPPTKVYDTFTRWVRAGVWQRVHDSLRDQLRVLAGCEALPDRGDHRFADRARRRHGAPVGSRVGWLESDEWPQTAHRAWTSTVLLLAVVVTAASIGDRDAAHRVLAVLRGAFFRDHAGLGRRRLPRTFGRVVETGSCP
ncbi:transposase [Rhodococcus sp. IEGM 1379]|uniref:transposase n=1 Tax=Rhodococcus sp. IEGM 1379 TaxID=3047086 RepID=UPI0024B83CB8|nr:transposase [Rhodococcus sp. IEGM 1379]MDI9915576.1 transposase [Rhodococcus sp. IEGM 1379]